MMNMLRTIPVFPILLAVILVASAPVAMGQEKDTLPALTGDKAPSNFEEMWAGFDPRAEPLEIETIKEWEEDGAILRIVRFRIGVFKGQKSKLAAIYGYPKDAVKDGSKLPGLLQIHGGGQYADQKAVIANAKRGYATLSIAWAGRISAKDYIVNPPIVQLFFDGKTDDPKYKLTTDWGALDGYHAPCRYKGSNFPGVKPYDWTIDSIESPRNSPWFLCAMAARRALTFLEKQPEVDAEKLGVYGHSMGGKLTVMTSVDDRVKAAAPSCGGISDRFNRSELFNDTVGDDVSLKQISCPIFFLSPSNDFHGRIGDLPSSISEIQSKQWRVTCSPHQNHKDDAEFTVAALLWFDQHLKGEFKVPRTPESKLELDAKSGNPRFSVVPDDSRTIRSIDIYYTQQGKTPEVPSDRLDVMSRFWRHVEPTAAGETWSAELPLSTTESPLWVYANVEYELEKPVSGAGYYYGPYTANSFVVSSLLKIADSDQLKQARVASVPMVNDPIEDFSGNWQKEWFSPQPGKWTIATHKVSAPAWQGHAGSKLALQVQTPTANKLVIMLNDHAAVIDLKGGTEFQDVLLSASDFENFDNETLKNWDGIRTLKFSDAEHLRGKERNQRRVVGKVWKGDPPKFRSLRWVE